MKRLIAILSIAILAGCFDTQAERQANIREAAQNIQAGIVAANAVACANQATANALIPTMQGVTPQQKALAIAAACVVATTAGPVVINALATPVATHMAQ